MKIRSLVCLFLCLAAAALALPSFADDVPHAEYGIELSEDGREVEVTIVLRGAVGVESANINLIYDTGLLKYDSVRKLVPKDIILEAGQSLYEENQLKIALMHSSHISSDLCDADGDLPVVTYVLKSADGGRVDPDKAEACFYMYAASIEVDGVEVGGNAQGNTALAEEQNTGLMAVPDRGEAGQGSLKSGRKGPSWYIYVVIGVAGLAVVAAVAFSVRNKETYSSDVSESGKKDAPGGGASGHDGE